MQALSSSYPHLDPTNKLQPRIFGSVSFVHVHSNERGKLDPRAIKCVFLGYSTTQKGYKCFHPPSRRFYVSRDVTFNGQDSYFKQPHLQGENVIEEDEPLMLPNMTFGPEIGTTSTAVPETKRSLDLAEQSPDPKAGPAPQLETNGGKFGKNLIYSRREKAIPDSIHGQESDPPSLHEVTSSNPINNSNEFVAEISEVQMNQNLHLPIALRKGTRTCTQQSLYSLSSFLFFKKFSPTHKTFLTNLNTTPTPSSVSEALSDRKWKQAMDVEMEALNKNKTWELATLPTGKKPVGCKWVYTIKYQADRTIEHYKARLVAKGFT